MYDKINTTNVLELIEYWLLWLMWTCWYNWCGTKANKSSACFPFCKWYNYFVSFVKCQGTSTIFNLKPNIHVNWFVWNCFFRGLQRTTLIIQMVFNFLSGKVDSYPLLLAFIFSPTNNKHAPTLCNSSHNARKENPRKSPRAPPNSATNKEKDQYC